MFRWRGWHRWRRQVSCSNFGNETSVLLLKLNGTRHGIRRDASVLMAGWSGGPVWLAGKRMQLLCEYQFAFAGDGQAVFLAGVQNAQLAMATKQCLRGHTPMFGRATTRRPPTRSWA